MPDDILQARTERFAREPAGVPDAVVPDATGSGRRMTPKARWTLAITSVAVFMVTLDNLVVTTAIPVIREDLHASLSGLQWTVNAYTLTFAVLLLTGAALGDRFGRRRLLAIGIAIFTVASAAAALAPSILALDVARAAQGVGGAIVMPLTLTVLSAAVPAERRGLALGIWGGISGLAVAFGPLVGGAIVSGHLLALDLLAQRPDRAAARAAHPAAARRDARARLQLRSARSGPGQRRPRRDRLGSGPRQRGRLDLPADHRRRSSSAARCWWRFVAWELRTEHPMLPMRFFAQPDVRAGQRRQPVHVLRDVRLDLLHLAVLPDRAGPVAVSVGAADPAVDGDADARRADRRRASPTASAAIG